jgi:signal transduction histidine kinase
MQWERLAVILSLSISIINGILVFFIYKRRQQPGAKGFLGLIIVITVYSFGYGFELAGNTVSQVKLWLNFEYLGITFIPFFWIAVVSDYAGLESRIKPLILAVLFTFSTTNLIIYLTNDIHHLFYSQLILKRHGAFVVAAFQREPWYWVNLAYIILSLFAGDIILLLKKERTVPLFHTQVNLLIFGSLIPWFGYILFVLGVSPWGLDLNPFSFSLTGLITAWGLFRYKLFDLSPIARDKTFETMRDGVLILDLQNRLVDFNNAAQNILTELKSSLLGYSVADAFQNYPELKNQILEHLEFTEFDIRTGKSRIYINSQIILVLSELKEPIGKIIFLSDVTEQRQSQAYILHAEKIAVLGRLAFNITRELNTPLMAIKATAEDLERSFDSLWRQVPELFGEMSENRRQLFLEIINKLRDIPYLTTREERDSLRKLSPVIQQLELKDIDNIARYFVKLGIADDFIRFAPILGDRKDTALLEFILVMALQRKDARTISVAEERTAKVWYALKSYSKTPEVQRPVLTDIQAGVEIVLRIYGNLIKNGVKTITYFEKVPQINACSDELQQVWTNLIHNAIQAMGGKGELMIEIQQKADEVIVSFTDTGPGIPAEILPQIFEPLFTTKKAGEGTGIGLTISKRIVERHGGKIMVQSKPGRTQFSVCLPLKGIKNES